MGIKYDVAMVLAAGKGVRMQPITHHVPKPMVRVDGVTLIDRVLHYLDKMEIRKIIVNSHHLFEVLEGYLRDRRRLFFSYVTLVHEQELLETAGGVLHAMEHLDQSPFWIINSDILWFDGPVPALARMAAMWDEKRMDALLLLQDCKTAHGYDGKGDFALTTENQLTRSHQSIESPYVYAGIQLVSKRLFTDYLTHKGPLPFNVIYRNRWQMNGLFDRLYGLVHDGEWLHVSTPDSIAMAETYIKNRSQE
jgi:MurNAc alpha-1-phosphate uridylyltransferase